MHALPPTKERYACTAGEIISFVVQSVQATGKENKSTIFAPLVTRMRSLQRFELAEYREFVSLQCVTSVVHKRFTQPS